MDAWAAGSLLVVALGALGMPMVARRVGVPVAVAEIAYGVAVGRSGLGLIGGEAHDIVAIIADLGFALFLFLAAMEIDVASLLRGGARAMAAPVIVGGAVLALALAIAAWLGAPAWLGLAIGVTSVPLVMAVLRELEILQSPFGRQILVFAGIGELLSIGLLAVFDLGAGAREAGMWHFALGLLRALAPLVATVLVALLLRSLLWWYPGRFLRLVSAEDPQELGVRAGFGLMFGGVVIAALGGIEPLLGAFFAGLIVAYLVRSRDVLEHKLAGVAYGFFVPVFFVNVGARLSITPALITENAVLIAGILVAMIGSRLPVLVVMARSGLGVPESVAAMLLLASPLTMQIAVANLGLRNEVFSEAVESAVVIAAAGAGVLYPALARRLLVWTAAR